ncbi:hypothetical protein DVH24_022527 [Malus domestica]|uniref:Uncharacterized protein n=1 Tax=Malus domestica TaxID=3750 RepID=A0A498KTT2_MALDO|nr:hypothetical protein DVH24_022527 [Malus domestica]
MVQCIACEDYAAFVKRIDLDRILRKEMDSNFEVFPAVPFLPIGRTAESLLGAMFMAVFRVLTPDQA